MVTRAPEKFKKHKFDITGDKNLEAAIQKAMTVLEADKASHMPTIVLFVEIPTNPDMKVPDIAKLAAICVNTKKETGKELILFVDTTFAPASKCMGHIAKVPGADELVTLNFISMSKSVSGGLCCAGTIIGGRSDDSIKWINRMRKEATMLDTHATYD
jgi:cystathionine beta-lyase/cystathionine gamma-synthase